MYILIWGIPKLKKQKSNHWKTASIILFVVFIVLLVYVFAFGNSIQNYKDIKQLTGITKLSTFNSVNNAIDKSPIHSVNLCPDLSDINKCIILGRLG